MKPYRILIVEDEPIVAMEIETLLGDMGFQSVGTAASGEAALAIVQQEPPDLILMDIRLKGDMDGIETAREIRARHRTPVVFVTAQAQQSTVERAKSVEPFGYVHKPFTDRELHTAIEMALYRHSVEEELHRVQAELRESKQRLQDIIRAGGEVIWEVDAAGRLTYVSEHIQNVLEYSPQEILGKRPPEFLKLEERWQWLVAFFAKKAQAKEGFRDLVYRTFTRSGRPVWLRNNAVPILDAAGELVGYRGSLRDITVRKNAEEEKLEMEERLRHAQKMEAIGTLSGGIAHDFNNILAAVMGYTELAMIGLPAESRTRSDLEQVLKASGRARDLVKQILTISRHGETHEKRPVKIAPIVNEAMKLLRATLPTTIEFRLSIEQEPHSVFADSTQIHQVVVNLCVNAAHAMHEKGGILDVGLAEVRLDDSTARSYGIAPGDYLRLSVGDTGHGMNRATLERIFDPYFTTKDVGEGSGLGLAVIQGIVRRHNGAIFVTSEPRKGSLFEIFLPVMGPASQDWADETEEATPRGSERVLVVDDELPLARMIQRILQNLGYQVTATADSRDALDRFKAQPEAFDLIVTDYTMPWMTGVDLAGQAMGIRPGIPVVLCTGYTDCISEKEAKAKGIREFCMKPLNRTRLAHVVRAALDRDPPGASL